MKGLQRCANLAFLLSSAGTMTFGMIEIWVDLPRDVLGYLLFQSSVLVLLVSLLTIIVLRLNHTGGDGEQAAARDGRRMAESKMP